LWEEGEEGEVLIMLMLQAVAAAAEVEHYLALLLLG
jgi:hypothetical protein